MSSPKVKCRVSRVFICASKSCDWRKAVQEQAERGGGKAERRVFLVGRRTLRRNIIKPRLETMVRGGGGVERCQPRMRKMWMSEILLC